MTVVALCSYWGVKDLGQRIVVNLTIKWPTSTQDLFPLGLSSIQIPEYHTAELVLHKNTTDLVAPDVIILKLVQPFNVCKYFNILFGVICRKTMRQEACVRMFSMKQIFKNRVMAYGKC